jgi:hypothetical protein
VEALRTFWRGRIIGRENRRIAAQQRNGVYWLHSGDQFKAAIEASGFRVEQERKLFRGYSDRVEAVAIAALTSQLTPATNQISSNVRLFAAGRAEGVAVLKTIDTQRLTISTADALYLDLRPPRKMQLCLAEAWSDPLVVLNSSTSQESEETTLTVALPRRAGTSASKARAIRISSSTISARRRPGWPEDMVMSTSR